MEKIGFLFLFLGLFAGNPAGQASECQPISVEEAYARANNVFIGKVMHIRVRPVGVKVSFKIYKVLKGALDDVATVRTSFADDMGLGFPFEEEEQYLVFTYLQDGRDHANVCTGTKRLSEASQDLKVLEKMIQQAGNAVEEKWTAMPQ